MILEYWSVVEITFDLILVYKYKNVSEQMKLDFVACDPSPCPHVFLSISASSPLFLFFFLNTHAIFLSLIYLFFLLFSLSLLICFFHSISVYT